MAIVLRPGDVRFVFNGQSRLLKLFVYGEGKPRRMWACHDVGVNDQYITAGEDQYGYRCKCPPGNDYRLGEPVRCGPNSSDGQAYGFWFTPIIDNPYGSFERHNRAGMGVHGGGSDRPDPFAPQQGWEYTFGCLRLQNSDNSMATPQLGTFVYAVQYVLKQDRACYLNVVWP